MLWMLLIPFIIASARKYFNLTGTVNGKLNLVQNNKIIETVYVTNATPVIHEVTLKDAGMEYLNNSASQILTFWFVDCFYYGVTDNLHFVRNYTTLDEHYLVEAFVIPKFDPLSTEPATLTTTTIQNRNITNSLNPSPITEHLDLFTTFNVTSNTYIGSHLPNKQVDNSSFPFTCENHTIVPISYNVLYGYFPRKIIVKETVSKIAVSGNKWIQRSEVLDLLVTCNSSSTFRYCYIFKSGIYNVTGNGTCHNGSIETSSCEFRINHYFSHSNVQIAVIIISNDVGMKVHGVYKVTKQTTWWIVIVQVAFSLLAISFIIFGVVYCLQRKSRYIMLGKDDEWCQKGFSIETPKFVSNLL